MDLSELERFEKELAKYIKERADVLDLLKYKQIRAEFFASYAKDEYRFILYNIRFMGSSTFKEYIWRIKQWSQYAIDSNDKDWYRIFIKKLTQARGGKQIKQSEHQLKKYEIQKLIKSLNEVPTKSDLTSQGMKENENEQKISIFDSIKQFFIHDKTKRTIQKQIKDQPKDLQIKLLCDDL